MLSLTASTALATILKIFEPILEPLFNAVGRSVNDYIDDARADANAKDLGQTKAELDTAKNTIAAQGAELDALANAPKSTTDAIKRLEEGSA